MGKKSLYGVSKYDGNFILECVYNRIKQYGNLFVVEKDGIYSCLNSNGDIIISKRYKSILPAEEWFIVSIDSDIYNKRVYGIIDSNENNIIPFFYTDIQHLGADRFCLKVQNKDVTISLRKDIVYSDIKPICKNLFKRKLIAWGIVDDEGNEVTPCIYSDIKYEENLDIFRVSTTTEKGADFKKWGLLDVKGRELCHSTFNKISTFKDGIATVSAYYGKGIMSKEGKLIPNETVQLDSTYSAVNSIGRWAFIKNNDNKLATEYKYKSITCLTPGFYVVEYDDTDYRSWENRTYCGLLDVKLNVIIPIEYNSISILSDQLILVGKKPASHNSSRWQYYYGCVTYNGHEIFSTEYDKISLLNNGLVKLEKYRSCSIYDQKGNSLIDCGFSNIIWGEVPNCYIVCKTLENYNIKQGLYDSKGFELIQPEYDELSFLHDDKLLFRILGSRGVCNTKGEIIIPCEYSSIEYCSDGYIVKKDYRSDAPVAKLNLNGIIVPNNITYLSSLYNKGEVFGKWGILDKCQNALTEYEYSSLECINRYIVYKKNGRLGLLDEKLGSVIDHNNNYSDIKCSNGSIKVCIKECWYSLDEEYQIKPIYTRTPQGNYIKRIPDGCSFCDSFQDDCSDKVYEDIQIINESVCIAIYTQNNKKVYKLTSYLGESIVELDYEYLESIGRKLFIVKYLNKFGIIDNSGREVVPMIFGNYERETADKYLFHLSIIEARKQTDIILSYCKKISLTEYQLQIDLSKDLPDFTVENPNKLELYGLSPLGKIDIRNIARKNSCKTFSELKKGIGYIGTVKNKTSWGVFIELECGIGLLHISEIQKHGLTLEEFIIGKPVTVQLLEYDRYKNRITLTV